MKICEFCGSTAADNIVQCKGCGAREFKNVCRNCGTNFSGSQCPDCGVVMGDRPRRCFHCGTKTFEAVCPDCGADLINGRKVQENPSPPIMQQRPKKQRDIPAFLMILVLIVGFIGIISFSNSDKNLPDMEVLTLKDHPKFYGDYNDAKRFWKGFGKVKVVNAKETIYHEDALLLITSADGSDDVITNVTINLSDYEKSQDLEFDDVLQLICEYIPYDIIDEYYDFKESFHEAPKDGKFESYHYVMELNEKGKEVKQSGERYLESIFAFEVIHREDNGWIAEIGYFAYKGAHDSFNPDAYNVEEWDVDLEKYRN